MLTEQENGHMSLRSNLWIYAIALGGLVVAAPAENTSTTPPNKTPPAPIVRTYVFPAVGFAPSSEIVRVTVVNIASKAHNGSDAACSGAILFSDATGKPLQAAVDFTKLGTGQIAAVDYPAPQNPPPPQIPGLVLKRGELQGSVQVTIDPAAPAPCSLLLTLEVYDSTTYATHALVTAAVEESIAFTPAGIGRGN
jgi:hypothetical protein